MQTVSGSTLDRQVEVVSVSAPRCY